MLFLILFDFLIEFSFCLFKLVNLLLQHFDVQLQLLLHFDVVPNFSLILLQLLFIFFGRFLNTLESRGELRRCGSPIPRHTSQHRVCAISASLLLLIQLHLHENLNARPDVLQDGD